MNKQEAIEKQKSRLERVERIYRNDLPKEDEMCRILEWAGKK